MPVITSAKQQKNEKRANIFLDGKFSFGLDLENFVKLGLKVGQELSEEQIKAIIDQGEKAKTLEKVMRFVNIRPRSKKEITDYFKRKRINELIHYYILEKLEKYDLINDLNFAKWWVDLRASKKSKRVLISELRIKGISKDIVDEVLENTKVDELKIAKELIAKKLYKFQKYDEKTRKQKISQYLAGKGFDWNIINDVLKYTTGDGYE